MDLLDRFHAQVARTPGREAVTGAGERLSYGELNERADRLAHALRARGVGPEVVVGHCLPRGPQAIAGLLAILKAGGVYLPLDREHPAQRLATLVGEANARFVLGTGESGFGVPLITPDAGHDVACTGPPERAAGADLLACVIFTSGSTGRPKGIGLPIRSIENVTDWALARAPGPLVCAQFCSLGFDVSLQEIFGTLLGGGRLVVVDEERRRDPYLLIDLLVRERVQRLHLTPSFLRQLAMAHADHPATLRDLRQVIAAGEPLVVTEEIRAFLTTVGAELENQYGPSETHQATANPLTAWPERPSLGRPIPGVTVHLLDPAGEPVRGGQEGEVYIGGRGVSRGYVGRAALTAERFVPDPFAGRPGMRMYRTGDRARWSADGELEFAGRADAQVKVRGFRVEPSETEAAIAAYPQVREAAVVPHRDADGDWRLDAYVVPADRGVAPDTAGLRDFLARRLPDYLVPATVQTLPALPLNRNGKVDRAALPLPATSDRRTSVPYARPENEQDVVVCQLIGEILGVEAVGVDDDFFELGGNSLLATRLAGRLAREFGVRPPVRAIFDHPTARGLGEVIEKAVIAEIRELADAGPEPTAGPGRGPEPG